MKALQQEFVVRYSYPVHFTSAAFALPNPLLVDTLGPTRRGPHGVLCVVDQGVVQSDPGLLARIEAYAGEHAHALRLVCAPMVLTGGEAGKNSEDAYRQVQTAIHEHGVCRQSYVLAIGGGAFLDLVGFAAATAHRGVRLIRMPTTVLSQDDSGVGVKNSVNAFGKKNFVGTFAPPFAVINDFAFLHNLSRRDWIAGTSEAVKVALLKDRGFFEFLAEHAAAIRARDARAMEHLVYRSAELHLRHIGMGGDPFETTSSRPLDFGHWAAHKLEQMSAFALRHGEAVAMGIALDTTYSLEMGWLQETDWRRILRVLTTLGFSLMVPEQVQQREEPDGWRGLLRGLGEFREHLGGELTITLLRGIGTPFDVHSIDEPAMVRALQLLQRVAAAPQELEATEEETVWETS